MSKGLLLKLLGSLQLLIYVGIAPLAYADTLIYYATTDFPVIDAGEVPYYKESPTRNALAINAAIEENRDKFARAELVYDGQAGRFDMTIVGLAELDGAAPYNLLVNGQIVGSATNPSVVTDYTPIRHTFEDVDVPSGATLAVESLANSNKLVPENDGFAFARGRWTALELTSVDSAPIPPNYIDLDLVMNSNELALTEGQEATITLRVGNATSGLVATTPLLRLTLPRSGLEFVAGTNCTVISLLIECALSEIAAGEQTSVNITLSANGVNASASVSALVRADQIDAYEVNNTAVLNFTIAQGQNTATPDSAGNPDSVTDTPSQSNQNAETVDSESGSLSFLWALLLLPIFTRTMSGRNTLQ